MSAAQQPAFDEATQVCVLALPLDHDDSSSCNPFSDVCLFCPSVEGARSVPGAGTVKGKDAGIHSRVDGQVLEHVSCSLPPPLTHSGEHPSD
jgi:hypothetical protein